ncbi:MAG TPA: phosphate signaling complex protein PhoU [Lachnospiraceae bacterium]|nr:phosphate signaling complex protein PhoU [Lachnospiraceae bacterium]
MSPRILFEQELEELKDKVIEMGVKIEEVYDRLFLLLQKKDREGMEEIVIDDRLINDMQRGIEAKCLSLLTKQQPVARDLRMVSAALKVVTDIERIGDHVSDMAELLLRMDMPDLGDFSDSLPKMIIAAKKIVCESIEAFVARDMDDAKDVIAYDDVIDDFFNQVKEDIINDLKSGKENADDCVDVLMLAKYLERVGDHAVNIGEWAIFQETGNIDDVRLL